MKDHLETTIETHEIKFEKIVPQTPRHNGVLTEDE